MKKFVRKEDESLFIVSETLIDLPSPSSISYMWSFGFLLSILLLVQIVTGLFLSIHFSAEVMLSFYSVVHMIRDVNTGWLIRALHSNGASMFFVLLYFHIGRGLYYGSYRYKGVWLIGVTIMLLIMFIAFLGYVLPWGQMSFWAATVITNLLTAVPVVGKILVEWVWGGYAVGNPTLTRFFVFHFILPFIVVFFVGFHLSYLHLEGSGNPLGLKTSLDSIVFHPYFVVKDIVGLVVVLLVLFVIILCWPYLMMDEENFIPSNPLSTPSHIQPEWYFLFAYCILRSVPSKVGGVLALMMSVLILYFFPFIFKSKIQSASYSFFGKFLFWCLVSLWGLLTWIGSQEVEYPYNYIGVIFSGSYFLMYFVMWIGYAFEDVIFD